MLPIIGVTTYQGENEEGYPIIALQRAYVDSLVQAGSVPVLIPSCLPSDTFMAQLGRLDGILFTGGGDVAIERFNGKSHPSISNVDPERDSLELFLLELFIKNRKPFLGICRGFQMINVGLGGTLYTDIKDQKRDAIKHDYYPGCLRSYLAHKVEVKSGTRLAKIMGETDFFVNSLHHQGIKDISLKLEKSAIAPDGLIEGVELTDHPFGIAVQWHPEWLKDQPVMKRLFSALVEAASL
ncbi:MAG: gamma-glutamyl-gamma-aminobutyrate hydrolase family protein [Flavisolibacter sp.]